MTEAAVADKATETTATTDTTAAADKAAADKTTADAAAATTGKTGDTKDAQASTDSTAAADATASQAPATYELKVPDGGLLHPLDLKVIEEQARKANLSNADAQLWVNEQTALLAAQNESFRAETMADKDLGGDHLVETQRLANLAIDRIFPKTDVHRDGFLAFLNRGGANNNIHVVRALSRIGQMMAEDSAVSGKSMEGGGEKKTPAQIMYPNMNP